jgi:hypothetical protein
MAMILLEIRESKELITCSHFATGLSEQAISKARIVVPRRARLGKRFIKRWRSLPE